MLLIGSMQAGFALVNDADQRRALVGVKLFAALLAADQDIETKAGPDDALHVLVVHSGDRAAAEATAERLRRLGTVRSIPLAIHVRENARELSQDCPPLAGVFVAEWLSRLGPVLELAERYRAVVFSPFLGDMDRGAHGGLFVSDRILPVVNPAALDAAGIRLKPFFLEVAKHHGPK